MEITIKVALSADGRLLEALEGLVSAIGKAAPVEAAVRPDCCVCGGVTETPAEAPAPAEPEKTAEAPAPRKRSRKTTPAVKPEGAVYAEQSAPIEEPSVTSATAPADEPVNPDAALSGESVIPTAAPAEEQDDSVNPDAAPADESGLPFGDPGPRVDLIVLRRKANELALSGHRAEVMAVLAQEGVQSFPDIPAERFTAVYAALSSIA